MSHQVRRARVLVVDDAANLRELMTLLLDSEDDFEVVGTAENGQEALTVAAAVTPDIVLLDLAMPVMDGMQALPILRKLLPGAAIVVFSGFEQSGLAQEALAAGADGYIEKGTSVAELISVLRRLATRSLDTSIRGGLPH